MGQTYGSGAEQDFFVQLSWKGRFIGADECKNPGGGHGACSSNFCKMVEEHDVVGDWSFGDKNGFLFLDCGLKAINEGLGGFKAIKECFHGLVALFVGGVILEEILPVVC